VGTGFPDGQPPGRNCLSGSLAIAGDIPAPPCHAQEQSEEGLRDRKLLAPGLHQCQYLPRMSPQCQRLTGEAPSRRGIVWISSSQPEPHAPSYPVPPCAVPVSAGMIVTVPAELPLLRRRAIRASEAAVRDGIRAREDPVETTGTGSVASRSGLFREPPPPRAAAAPAPAKADRLTSGMAVAPSSQGELSTLLSREAKCLAPGCSTTARRPKEPDCA
jgi:hypothetical protein